MAGIVSTISTNKSISFVGCLKGSRGVAASTDFKIERGPSTFLARHTTGHENEKNEIPDSRRCFV
jgi:hypothetical protein